MDKLLEYYSHICRVCLQAMPDMESLHGDDSLPKNSAKISEVIMACASVQIKENDGLPNHICERCMYELQASLKFKLLCETSDAELRRHLLQVGNVESALAAVENQSESITKPAENCKGDEAAIDGPRKANSSLLIYVEKEESGNERLENAERYSDELLPKDEVAKRENVMKMIKARQEDMMLISRVKRENLMKINAELRKIRLKSSRRKHVSV